ncbi:MAG: hypothetical protein IT473_12695 [Lysobacter sp.]|nr:hypothetical protein [Lysobacter sp.]
MKSRTFSSIRRRFALASALVLALAASASAPAQQYAPRYVWITMYFNNQGSFVGGVGYGDCGFPMFGQQTSISTTEVYECDGELPF